MMTGHHYIEDLNDPRDRRPRRVLTERGRDVCVHLVGATLVTAWAVWVYYAAPRRDPVVAPPAQNQFRTLEPPSPERSDLLRWMERHVDPEPRDDIDRDPHEHHGQDPSRVLRRS